MPMTDNTELQRVMRLRRLGRQIAASLPVDLDRELAFQVHGYGELPVGAPSRMSKPASSKAALRARRRRRSRTTTDRLQSVRRQAHRSPSRR
jgi:hypothetical protein